MARGAPALGLLLLEGQRALLEAMTLPGALPLLRRAPRGDGHPVLVLPGFGAGDGSTRVLRGYLKRQGHSPHPWLLGRNLGPSGDLRRRLIKRVDELVARYGEPVSIVGWSLGGIYARELAKTSPHQVRQVITLGSPFGDVARPSNLSRIFQRVRGNPGRERINQFARALREPPADVPCTAIYSRTDGIVHWSACLEPETPRTDNIEVPGSHLGLGVNPLVLYAITDRLSQPADEWKRFERTGWRRRLYREAPYAVYRDD